MHSASKRALVPGSTSRDCSIIPCRCDTHDRAVRADTGEMRSLVRASLSSAATVILGLLTAVIMAVNPNIESASAQQDDDSRPVVYLTFDSGPGPRTPEFLEVLDQWDAKATFFVIGRNVHTSPEMLERIVEAGHAVGNHTWSHEDLTQKSLLEAQTDLRLANQAVIETVGLRPRCWRPTFGLVNDDLIEVAAREGLSNNSWIPSGRWDVDTVDWKYGYEFVLARLQTVGPGDVVLMHGGMNPDHEDLAALMTWLQVNGDTYRFETLPGCTPTRVPSSTPPSAGDQGPTDPAPGSLAATDATFDLFNRDPTLWIEIHRGSAYLSAFGPSG